MVNALYESAGNIVSMNLNGVEYYYIKNSQSDIIGLFNNEGTQVVSYVYDSWGKLESTTGTLASTVGVKNPCRYKGYRDDTETGLYYLNSRYYNPEWGRMLNADDPGVATATLGELTDKNLFAYCDNNPIMRVDEDGHFWETFFDVANLGYSVFNIIKNPSWVNLGYLIWDAGATLVPFVPGSYTAKAFKVAGKASEGVKVSKGYKPLIGERSLEAFLKKSVSADKEISLYTKSSGFNSNIGGEFKRFGAGSHGGVSPHVHQPFRNISPNGNVYGGVGRHTYDGGVTSPSRRDIKQLYSYLYNGKYRP